MNFVEAVQNMLDGEIIFHEEPKCHDYPGGYLKIENNKINATTRARPNGWIGAFGRWMCENEGEKTVTSTLNSDNWSLTNNFQYSQLKIGDKFKIPASTCEYTVIRDSMSGKLRVMTDSLLVFETLEEWEQTAKTNKCFKIKYITFK